MNVKKLSKLIEEYKALMRLRAQVLSAVRAHRPHMRAGGGLFISVFVAEEEDPRDLELPPWVAFGAGVAMLHMIRTRRKYLENRIKHQRTK